MEIEELKAEIKRLRKRTVFTVDRPAMQKHQFVQTNSEDHPDTIALNHEIKIRKLTEENNKKE